MRAARFREPVVAPQPRVDDLLVVELDEALRGEPVERPVERADAKGHRTRGDLLDVLDDAVTMLRAGREGREDEERRLLQPG